MVSGLVTSPCDQLRIFSGEARLIRMESKSAIKFALSYGEERYIISPWVVGGGKWAVGPTTYLQPLLPAYQSAARAVSAISRGFFINSTSRHSDCSSRIRTLKDSGTPGSAAASPFTMAS